jgi:dCMP deaminase
VAAIIISGDAKNVYSIGINGGPTGGVDCLCTLGGKYTCIHAEANALAKFRSVYWKDTIMIVTMAPCVTCASLIANSGIAEVIYLEDYKDNAGLGLLLAAGVKCTFYKDEE